ncbi:DUF998 domain-containing protein [Curtobacterium sp. MCLR17_032]|uniref:DUF998 domain-containing protein n=1 Tax=Curtobacterium sp. MCLR17_032 TaxID=2175650 RepID=UPI000DA8A641|nr:DUF998 domain-containing protein [Curtobacterium sp. MCLR17_032]WIE60124.1 DUF998 domain-containing protein [Curtobacterium sp. MCLR17_032]
MRPHQSAIAASCWIAAAALYLFAEAVSASAFPGYSYATNYISDLGVPDTEMFQGRAIDSPLHLLMNTAFVLHGVLFVVAALAARTLAPGSSTTGRPAARRWFTVLAVAHGVGIVLVGLFHGSQASVENGLVVLHVLGAAVAITAGNTAAVVAGVALLRHAPEQRSRGARWVGVLSVALGAIGLVGLVMLVVDPAWTAVDLLPDGVWERAAVYAILAWELLAGVAVLSTAGSRTDRVHTGTNGRLAERSAA